jgi:hypothetical protein
MAAALLLQHARPRHTCYTSDGGRVCVIFAGALRNTDADGIQGRVK